ncbi:MAG TPA: putative sulfate exporter family transporter [Ruminiclostridium sp.]
MKGFKEIAPGLFFATALAIIAALLGRMAPIIGGPVFAIVLGILISSIWGKSKTMKRGLSFSSKKILQWSIIALGAGLSLTEVYKVGFSSLYVMIFTLSAAFITAYGFGKLMKIPLKLTSLIGMGTAICGGSAIAAIAPIIEAEDKDIAYSISTVFMFNIMAVLIFPPIGHLLGFSDNAFGLWAGTAINDTSSVVAAGYAFSNAAGAYATIVKLTRTTMIIPISLIFAAVVSIQKKREANRSGEVNYSFRKIFPWFIVWFLVASLLNTVGVINEQAAGIITEIGKFFIVVALAAIGLNSDFKEMRKTGLKPMLLGLIVWASVTVVSLLVQYTTGNI